MIEAGTYRVWDLTERVRAATPTPVDETYVFSYEFTVEEGPAVTLAVTTADELSRRGQTGGQYQVFSGTRIRGHQGAISESIVASLLDALVVDTQYIGPDTPTPNRGPATVHVVASLSSPKGQ